MKRTSKINCSLQALLLLCVIALSPLPVHAQTATASVPVANGSYGVAFTPNGEYAYVTNQNGGTVSVIRTATDSVVDKIALGSLPYAVAVTPNGAYVYVTNLGNSTVSVINTATNKLTATVTVGNDPAGIAITPDGKYAYVANEDALSDSNSVSVINTATNTVTATVSIGRSTSSVALTPDGKYAYVTSYGYNGSLSVIDTATNKVATTVPVGSWPLSVTISPNGKYAYVTHDIEAINYVSVIDTATNTETAKVIVGNDTQYTAFTPNSEYAFITVLPPPPKNPGQGPLGNGTVAVVDTATNKLAANLTVSGMPLGLAISPNGAYAYVTTLTNQADGAVLMISTSSLTAGQTAVPEFPWLALPPLIAILFLASVMLWHRKKGSLDNRFLQ